MEGGEREPGERTAGGCVCREAGLFETDHGLGLLEVDVEADGGCDVELELAAFRVGPSAEEVDGVALQEVVDVAVHMLSRRCVGRESVLHGVEDAVAFCLEEDLGLNEGASALFDVVARDGA